MGVVGIVVHTSALQIANRFAHYCFCIAQRPRERERDLGHMHRARFLYFFECKVVGNGERESQRPVFVSVRGTVIDNP